MRTVRLKDFDQRSYMIDTGNMQRNVEFILRL